MLVIIETPYKDLKDKNYIVECLLDSIERGEAPFASHVMYTGCLNDNDPKQRLIGMGLGFQWHKVAEKMVVYSDYGVSSGMKKGIDHANRIGLKIEYRRIND